MFSHRFSTNSPQFFLLIFCFGAFLSIFTPFLTEFGFAFVEFGHAIGTKKLLQKTLFSGFWSIWKHYLISTSCAILSPVGD
jgi:hypothetical protein